MLGQVREDLLRLQEIQVLRLHLQELAHTPLLQILWVVQRQMLPPWLLREILRSVLALAIV